MANPSEPIGSLIRKKIKEDGRTAAQLCLLLEMTRGNLDKIYQKDSITTDLLARFCLVLNYDFFQHVNPYSEGMGRTRTETEEKLLRERIALQAHEISLLRGQIEEGAGRLRDKEEIILLQREKIAMLEQKLFQITSKQGN